MHRQPPLDQPPPHHLGAYDRRLLLRSREGADLLGISPSKMAELLANGTIPSIRIGRSRRIILADLEQWVADRAVDAQ